MSRPVDPHQNVSPTQSTHFNSENQLSGASISSGGGCPLRLSLAASLLGSMIASGQAWESRGKAFELADELIAKYNADLAAEKAAANPAKQQP